MSNLVWFKSDLRIYDNPALSAAMKRGPTVAVYLLTQQQWDEHGVAPAKRALIIGQLRQLAMQLETLNVPLKVVDCGRFSACANTLSEIASELGIAHVYFNREYEVNEKACEVEVQTSLAEVRVQTSSFHDSCMVAPGMIRTKEGACYKVFTAFKRTFLSQYDLHARAIHNRPEQQEKLTITSDLRALDEVLLDPRWTSLWPAGEDEAHDRLNNFIEHRVKGYANFRDIPSEDGTSGLSPYLAVGALTTTQCMQAAISLNEGSITGGHPGVSVWINELIWREFYRHLLDEYPRLSKAKPFKQDTDRLPWKHDTLLFQAWATGKTGYPIVDAAMRQLSETGWMHNRLRMITAMFLTKHLFIDWRWGEQFFMEHLVDGDLASNNGGWQWSASTGVDSVPYFRIFNPTRQSQRFDTSGDFIRRYVPELQSLDNLSIHQPSVQQALALDYPLPVVDHRMSVEQTKRWFKQLSDPPRQADTDLFATEEKYFV